MWQNLRGVPPFFYGVTPQSFCHGLPTNGDFRRHSNLLFLDWRFYLLSTWESYTDMPGNSGNTESSMSVLNVMSDIFVKTTNAHEFTLIIIYSFLFVGRRCRRKPKQVLI